MKRLIIILCVICACSRLTAYEHVDSTHVHTIANITVRGNYLASELIPVQTLQGDELQLLASHSVADAIRYFSGLQIKDYGGIGGLKTVNIRGMGSEHIGVFYDGIELGNAQNGVIDLGRFSLDNIESISVYNGQKSDIFQSAKDFSSASSVYLQTRNPSFKNGTNTNVKASFKTGSFGVANPSFLWEQRITHKINSSFNAEYLYTTGRYKFTYKNAGNRDTTSTRRNGEVSAIRVEHVLNGNLPHGEWRIKNYFYSSRRGYPGAVLSDDPGRFIHADTQWDVNYFLQGSLKEHIAPWYDMQINAKYAYDYMHYSSDPKKDVTVVALTDNHFHQKEYYLSTAHLFKISHAINADISMDAQRNTLNADLDKFVDPRRWTIFTAAATALNLNHIKMQGSLLYTYIHEKVNSNGSAAPDKNKFTPTLTIAWQPRKNGDLSLRAFYKQSFRMPTFNDLYYTSIGNSVLKPEQTTQYDCGFTYGHNFQHNILYRIELQADGYYNHVTNKIVAVPADNQFRWMMMNIGKARINGMDIGLSTAWQIDKLQFGTRLAYTHERAKDLSMDRDSPYYGGQIPYIPWNNASFVLNGSYRLWDFSYSFIYTGKRYDTSTNIEVNRLDAWSTHDFSLSHNIKWHNIDTKLSAEVNNIFNCRYEVVSGYPMPGRNYKIILNIKL